MEGVVKLTQAPETIGYLRDNGLTEHMENASHILWATGGSLVPEEIREEYIHTHLE